MKKSSLELLPNTCAIHSKLRDMFSDKTKTRRRVIMVAYVGDGAARLLPNVEGVKIYCWPEPGSTSGPALKTLKDKGASIEFVDGFHGKLYWVQGKGAVVTSANLSRSALEDNARHEIGVFLKDFDEKDLQRILDNVGHREPTVDDLNKLTKTRSIRQAKSSPGRKVTYSEWFEKKTPVWKLGWWEEDLEPEDAAKCKRRAERPDYTDVLSFRGKQIEEGDWLLRFKVKDGVFSNIEWFRAVFLHRNVDKSSSYPHVAYAIKSRSRSSSGPFELSKEFKKAFQKAAMASKRHRSAEALGCLDDLRPDKQLLLSIWKEMSHSSQ